MPRPRSTTDRGYGWRHQRVRKQLLAAHVDGDLCDRCWQPMVLDPTLRCGGLDAAHPHDRPLALFPDQLPDHLEHTTCNASWQDKTDTQRPGLRTSRDW